MAFELVGNFAAGVGNALSSIATGVGAVVHNSLTALDRSWVMPGNWLSGVADYTGNILTPGGSRYGAGTSGWTQPRFGVSSAAPIAAQPAAVEPAAPVVAASPSSRLAPSAKEPAAATPLANAKPAGKPASVPAVDTAKSVPTVSFASRDFSGDGALPSPFQAAWSVDQDLKLSEALEKGDLDAAADQLRTSLGRLGAEARGDSEYGSENIVVLGALDSAISGLRTKDEKGAPLASWTSLGREEQQARINTARSYASSVSSAGQASGKTVGAFGAYLSAKDGLASLAVTKNKLFSNKDGLNLTPAQISRVQPLVDSWIAQSSRLYEAVREGVVKPREAQIQLDALYNSTIEVARAQIEVAGATTITHHGFMGLWQQSLDGSSVPESLDWTKVTAAAQFLTPIVLAGLQFYQQDKSEKRQYKWTKEENQAQRDFTSEENRLTRESNLALAQIAAEASVASAEAGSGSSAVGASRSPPALGGGTRSA